MNRYCPLMTERFDKTDIRQGRTGTGLRYVLIASLVLAVLAMAAVIVYFAG